MAVKHDIADIKLAKEGKKRILVLFYSDNGKGFDKEKVIKEKSGLGLFNIKNRIQTIGGNILVFSKPNKGMIVEIKVKLED